MMIDLGCDGGFVLGTSSIGDQSTLEGLDLSAARPDVMFGDRSRGVGGSRQDSLHFAASGQRAAGWGRGHLARRVDG